MIRMSPIKNNALIFRTFYASLVSLSLALAAATTCGAQSGPNRFYGQPSTLTGKILIIPAGTTLEGRIESTIGSSKSHQGERFSLTISSPVLANGSEVIIPVGSEILGDVVEAIPANKVPRQKGMVKPVGKLRVQISSLKMPDGATYPLVASIVGEKPTQANRYGNDEGPDLGTGVGFVGTENNFEAVAPRSQASRGRPKVLTRRELMSDPIYGKNSGDGYGNGRYDIRSLVKKDRNLFIYKGSPVSVRLKAALKIGMGASEGEASILQSPAKINNEPESNDFSSSPHRFTRPAPPAPPPVVQVEKPVEAPPYVPPAVVPNVLPGILPDSPALVLPPPNSQKPPATPPPQSNQQVSPF